MATPKAKKFELTLETKFLQHPKKQMQNAPWSPQGDFTSALTTQSHKRRNCNLFARPLHRSCLHRSIKPPSTTTSSSDFTQVCNSISSYVLRFLLPVVDWLWSD
ncbi:hypothetical protein LXL04_005943 [Taraxacum kok-saghyz]